MYWISGKWFLSCQTSRYDPCRIRYIVLIKQSPFKNGHPSLEPDLAGFCISADMDDVKDLAADFIRSAEQHGVPPASPYTRASAAYGFGHHATNRT